MSSLEIVIKSVLYECNRRLVERERSQVALERGNKYMQFGSGICIFSLYIFWFVYSGAL